jgi:predicted nucleic acid-binding Zn ribbon protein
MPVYQYQCTDENCGLKAAVVAGLDDATAICSRCGGLMLRLDEDLFTPYFEFSNFKEA